jgi:DNA-directed RNA polymerase subunit H (RpoH/RPB5)
MALTPSPICVVGTILSKFFEYRGLVPAAPGLGPGAAPDFTEDRIISDMEQFGLVRIDATRTCPRGRRNWVVILVLSSRGKYAHHSPDLRKLLRGIETERPAKDGRLDELLVVAEEEFFSRKNLTDLIGEQQAQDAAARREQAALLDESHQRAAPPEAARIRAARQELYYGDTGGVAPYREAHPYHRFAVVVPEHTSVPAHIVMPAEWAAAFLAYYRLNRSSLPVLRASDPAAVWAGARSGQVVMIVRDSATAGIALGWRRVDA